MRIKRLNGMYTIGSQLELTDILKVNSAGYRSIMCMRPDEEGTGQVEFRDVRQEAEKFGIETMYLPIALTGDTEGDLDSFAQAIDTLPKPILAYCRSGTRCATLWAKWEHRMEGFEAGGQREMRVGGMRAGALDGGGMSLAGKRPSARMRSNDPVSLDERRSGG